MSFILLMPRIDDQGDEVFVMIRIRLTGTRDELTSAFSVIREGYKVLSRSKPHKVQTDTPSWSMYIKAEIKSPNGELQSPPSRTALVGHDEPAE
jgi:hypothetical protein